MTQANNHDEEGPMVQYGGILADNESDEVQRAAVEARALSGRPERLGKAPLKVKPVFSPRQSANMSSSQKMTKIEANPEAQPKTLKEVRGGDDKWALKHLPEEARIRYTNEVVPLARKKAGSLNPWDQLTAENLQTLIDKVFGKGQYRVTNDGVWQGLVRSICRPTSTLTNLIQSETLSRLQNWRNGFAQSALDAIDEFIEANKSKLNTPEAIAEQVEMLLEKTKITTDSEQYTYAYQWAEWENATERKAFLSADFSFKIVAHPFCRVFFKIVSFFVLSHSPTLPYLMGMIVSIMRSQLVHCYSQCRRCVATNTESCNTNFKLS